MRQYQHIKDSYPVKATRPEGRSKGLNDEQKAERKKQFDAYWAAQAAADEEFKQDVFKEFGVQDNPKRQKCFELAWSHGHSSGYQEVIMYFEEFVELIK